MFEPALASEISYGQNMSVQGVLKATFPVIFDWSFRFMEISATNERKFTRSYRLDF